MEETSTYIGDIMINWLEELAAQIQVHGIDAVVFFLGDGEAHEGMYDKMPLDITDVQYVRGSIEVTLGT
jgi:hypothetical protein